MGKPHTLGVVCVSPSHVSLSGWSHRITSLLGDTSDPNWNNLQGFNKLENWKDRSLMRAMLLHMLRFFSNLLELVDACNPYWTKSFLSLLDHDPDGNRIICATYFPIPKALTEYSERVMPTLSCPYNYFLNSPEKIVEEGLLVKIPHISQFLCPTYDRPTLDITRVSLVMFSHQETQWSIAIVLSFVKINQKLPSVNMNRDVNTDYIKLLRTYSTYAHFLFSLMIISQTKQVLSAFLTPAWS